MLSERVFQVLTVSATLGAGLAAGVFFAFSSFVMAGLARLPPAQGIAAMQAINLTAVTPLFMTVLFGTALACAGVAVHSILTWNQNGSVLLVAAAALYIVGIIVVTIVFNVPLNDALAAVSPDSQEGADLWIRYLASWNAWNHVRTLAGLAALGAFVMSLRVP